MERMKIKLTIPESVRMKLNGMVSRGIKALEVDENGHLIVTLTDNSVHDLGKVSGEDGVSVTHEWIGTVLRVTSASGTSEADLKGRDGVNGTNGKDGYTPVKDKDYFDGKNGVSATHRWDGTVLTMTSASGTSSADLKGDKGERGEAGAGLMISGSVATYADLPNNLTLADAGKAYFVEADGKLYIWSGTAFPANGEGSQFKGDKGDPGNDYILTDGDKDEIADQVLDMVAYVQPNPPPDDAPENSLWIDTDEDMVSEPLSGVMASINNGISVIDTGLTYTRGIVEVRRMGDILWIIDSGVYNFTANFAAAKNRTVLEFSLPKDLSNKMPNVNGVYGTTGTIGYFPALAYENVTYTTFNCQSYLKRSAVGDDKDTFQLVYTGLSAISGGGLCGFHLKMPLILVDKEA